MPVTRPRARTRPQNAREEDAAMARPLRRPRSTTPAAMPTQSAQPTGIRKPRATATRRKAPAPALAPQSRPSTLAGQGADPLDPMLMGSSPSDEDLPAAVRETPMPESRAPSQPPLPNPPPPADYGIDLRILVHINGVLIATPMLDYPVTRHTLDSAKIWDAIRDALVERGDVDIDGIGPRDVNIACVVRDQRKRGTQKLILHDLSVEAEFSIIEVCDKMRIATKNKAVLQVDIPYRLQVDRSRNQPMPSAAPHRSREGNCRPGTPVSEATFVQDGSLRTRTNEQLAGGTRPGIQQPSAMTARDVRRHPATEAALMMRWRCTRDQCPNYRGLCFVAGSSPPRHYNIPDAEIKRWAILVRAGQGSLSHPPELVHEAIVRPGACEEAESRRRANGAASTARPSGGQSISDLTGVLAAHVLDNVSRLLENAAPSASAPAVSMATRQWSKGAIQEDDGAEIVCDFLAWMVAKQTDPIRHEVWRSTSNIVRSNCWTLRELKDMKMEPSLSEEAVEAGIKAPIARQFRDRLAEFRGLIKRDTNARIAAMSDEVAAIAIAEATRAV